METTNDSAQTPGQKVEEETTTVNKQVTATINKTFTQAELDAIVQDRLDREKKKYADYKDLKAASEKLKAFEAEKLTDQEKAKQKLVDLEKAISEKENLLKARDLKDKKRSALEAANLGLTEGWTLSDILDLMPGDEESISQEIEKWKKRFPSKKSLGTGTQNGNQSNGALSLDDQIAGLTQQLKDPKLTKREKQQLAQRSAQLQTKRMLERAKTQT